MQTARAEPVDTPRPRRTIAPRRTLPSGRALIGAFLVTLATLGAFALATRGDDGPDTRYLVATRDLRVGDTVTLTDVRFEAMTLSDDLASRILNSTAGLEGATILRDLRAGELMDIADVIPGAAPPTEDGAVHEVTIGIPLDRTPSSLVVGDRVTILATGDDRTRVAVEDARVLEIDRRPDQIGASGRGVLTLAIGDPLVVLEVAHLTQTTDITVVRSTRALADVFPAETATERVEG